MDPSPAVEMRWTSSKMTQRSFEMNSSRPGLSSSFSSTDGTVINTSLVSASLLPRNVKSGLPEVLVAVIIRLHQSSTSLLPIVTAKSLA